MADPRFQKVVLTLKDTKGRDVVEIAIDVGPNGVSFGGALGLSAVKLIQAYDVAELAVEMMPPPGEKR